MKNKDMYCTIDNIDFTEKELECTDIETKEIVKVKMNFMSLPLLPQYLEKSVKFPEAIHYMELYSIDNEYHIDCII